MADYTDPPSPDHNLADLPADQGGFAAQLHVDGAAWRDQTAADSARVSRRPRGLLPAAAILGVIGLLAAVLHGLLAQNGIAPPAGWQTRTPPTVEQFASYAVSPDVPGLIVACIGDQTPHVSAGQMGPAHIWRSRDAGRHWQKLEVSGFYAGCGIALPAGGRGTVVVLNHLDTEEYVAVSHDAGDTWKTVASEGSVQWDREVVRSTFNSLSTGIYRDDRLYALTPTQTTADRQPGAYLAKVLAYTPDDGATWIPIETTPDPLGAQGFLALTIAADYRAPAAWFRVLARGPYPAQSSAASAAVFPAAYLQHSTDDGRTWTTLGPIGPGGPTGAARYYYELGSVGIATTPSHPSRICASFVASQLTRTGAAARTDGALTALGAAIPAVPAIALGPPYREPLDVALEASSDGGHSWTGGTIVHHQHNEGFVGGAARDQGGPATSRTMPRGRKPTARRPVTPPSGACGRNNLMPRPPTASPASRRNWSA
jgi:hypothetical protein